MLRLRTVACAEIDQLPAVAEHAGDVAPVLGEDRRLGARRIVFVELAQGGEEGGAERIVEILGGNGGRDGEQSAQELLARGRAIGLQAHDERVAERR